MQTVARVMGERVAGKIADHYGFESQKKKTVEELIELADTLIHYDDRLIVRKVNRQVRRIVEEDQ